MGTPFLDPSTTTIYLAVSTVAVALALVLYVVFRLRGRKHEPVRNPYVDGLTRLIDGDSAGAFEKLEQSVRSGYAPADAYIRLGRMLRERGDATRALQIHKSLTVRDDLTRGEKLQLFLDMAEDYSALDRSDQAVNVLDTAARRMGMKEPRVFRILARESQRLGRTEESYNYMKEWKKAGGVGDRELALFLASAGSALVDDGGEREGRRLLERALKHDPECAPALMSVGDASELAGRMDDAILRWREAVQLSAELAPVVLRRLERATFQTGSFSDMERVYREVLASRPDDEAATLALAAFYKKQGRGEDAIVLLEDFRSEHSDAMRPTLLLTTLYATERGNDSITSLLAETRSETERVRTCSCQSCGYVSEAMRWHCPKCNEFDSFQIH